MSEIEIFLELLDEKMLNKVLTEFFSDNNPKQPISVKRMKIQKLLREPITKKMNKAYRTKGQSCIQVLNRELADSELLEQDMDDFIETIISGKKDNLSNVELFCTAYTKFPEIIREYFCTIASNHKEGAFLFKGIDAFNLSQDHLDTLELSKLQQDVKFLKEEVEKIRLEAEQARNESVKLNNQKNEIANENKKLKKNIKKQEQDIAKINKEVSNLQSIIQDKENLIINKDKINKELKEGYEKLKADKELINNKYKELKNKDYIEINDDTYMEYKACLIYTSSILATRSLFRDILFISYDDYTKDSNSLIKRLKKLNINNVYLMSNNISTREIGTLKRKMKNEKMNYKTILSACELNMVKELLENTWEDDNEIWING